MRHRRVGISIIQRAHAVNQAHALHDEGAAQIAERDFGAMVSVLCYLCL